MVVPSAPIHALNGLPIYSLPSELLDDAVSSALTHTIPPAHSAVKDRFLLLVIWLRFGGGPRAGRAEEQRLPIRKGQVPPVGSVRPVFRLVPFNHDLGAGQ